MKVLCVMAAHRRPEITFETIEMLKNIQTLAPMQVLVVGDSEVEEAIADRTNSLYQSSKNQPLGRKWQAGISAARQRAPDAILILGSDTWLSKKWIELCAEQLEKGYDVVGKNRWYTCHAMPEEQVEIIQRGYVTLQAREHPVGGGRLISSRILECLNWDLYPATATSALDTRSFYRLKEHGASFMLLNDNEELKVMGIKSTWQTLNKFTRLKTASQLAHYPGVPREEIRQFIETNFPGGVAALGRAVKGVII